MEAKSLRQLPLPVSVAIPVRPAVAPDDWAWVYEDPDLAPFLAGPSRRRKETPLTAWT